jgi:hypothetical protein
MPAQLTARFKPPISLCALAIAALTTASFVTSEGFCSGLPGALVHVDQRHLSAGRDESLRDGVAEAGSAARDHCANLIQLHTSSSCL